MSHEPQFPPPHPSPIKGEGELDEHRFDRLRWRCRRGLLELDLILGDFLRVRYVGLSPTEQRAFEELLTLPDTNLVACLQGQENPPQELEEIVRKIRQ